MRRSSGVVRMAVGALVFVGTVGIVSAETAGTPAPGKTIGDFLRESGTKPAIAIQQYQEYRRTQQVPRRSSPVTLLFGKTEAEELEQAGPGKTLQDFQRAYSGTKPVVAINKYHEYLRRHKTVK